MFIALIAERIAMSQASVCTASTTQERFEQYTHPAYRGTVDVHDDWRLVVIPPASIYGLPIHPYFLQPTPDDDIPLEELAELCFKGENIL